MSRVFSGLPALVAALALLLTAVPALAHKIKVFATAEGAAISGYVYFPGGGRATGAEVTVTGPDGAEIGRLRTDGEGVFRFQATRRIDHTFTADTGDGHRGGFVVKAGQLPAALGGEAAPGAIGGDFGAGRAAAPANGGGSGGGAGGGAGAPAAPVVDPAALEDAIARAVAREVNPLREQIEAYEERIRLHDILGGLGWIAGIAGLGFFVLGRRRG